MSAATLTAAEAGCPFCKLVMERVTTGRGIEQIGSSGVYHFEPLNPVTPGHRLFIPAFHYEDAAEAPTATGAVFEWAAWWAAQQDEDFNLIVNAGPAASQTVRHLHIHYVPRRPSDALNLEKYILARNPVYGDCVDTDELRADLKRIVKARNAREEKANAKKLLANAEKSLRLGNDV